MQNRFPSPNAGVRAAASARGASLPNRSQSAERRRPPTPVSKHSATTSPCRPSTHPSPAQRSTTPVRESAVEAHGASRRLVGNKVANKLWPSMRSLASFQSESGSAAPIVEKDKQIRDPSPVMKKDRAMRDPSPVMKRDRTSVRDPSPPVRSLKPVASMGPEKKRMPLTGRNSSEQSENLRTDADNPASRAVEHHRPTGIVDVRLAASAMSKSVDLGGKINRSASLPVLTRGVSLKKASVTDGTTSFQEPSNEAMRRAVSDGGRKAAFDMSMIANSPSNPSERGVVPVTRSRRSQSPMPSLHRPSSPNKALLTSSSISRGMQSSTRTHPSTIFPSSINSTSSIAVAPSISNYISDTRKAKRNPSHVEDAHQLRLLYNRNMQWRFVNDFSDAVSVLQKLTVERTLFAVLDTTSELRDSVVMKRKNLQQLKQEIKLKKVLKEQVGYLEDWASAEADHCITVAGAIEALQASMLRLPVTSGARVDLRAVKRAIGSALDIMQAICSSIYDQLSKVENVSLLTLEASSVAARERAMLDEFRDMLASAGALQVQEASLRSQLMQLRQGFD